MPLLWPLPTAAALATLAVAAAVWAFNSKELERDQSAPLRGSASSARSCLR